MEQWLMDMGSGIINVFHLTVFIASLCGVIAGIIIGILPGLGPPVALSLAIPITYGFEPIVAMSIMIGLYKGGTYGGSISAILINTPGTPAASATVLDGYKLAQQGKAGESIRYCIVCFGLRRCLQHYAPLCHCAAHRLFCGAFWPH